jgi:hypothetical protein
MKNVVKLSMAAVLLSAAAAKPITIAGLAYSIGDPDENLNAPADVVEGATVTLYKRTAEGSWEQGGSSTTTSNKGYYHFDNVSTIGTAWFKVHFDAENCIPNWDYQNKGWERDRVAYKEVRPSGIPDEGIIRVDAIYTVIDALVTQEPEEWYYGFQGRFVYIDPQTEETIAPDMGEAEPSYPWHQVTCPPTENPYEFKGCRAGDWWSLVEDDVSEYLTEAGWAHYQYYYPAVPPRTAGSFGDAYYYWSPTLPWWTLHGPETGGMGPDYVQKIDVVDLALPEE